MKISFRVLIPFGGLDVYDSRLIWVNGHRSLRRLHEFLSVAFEEWCLLPRRREGEERSIRRGKKEEKEEKEGKEGKGMAGSKK